jgi:hypothetical protein
LRTWLGISRLQANDKDAFSQKCGRPWATHLFQLTLLKARATDIARLRALSARFNGGKQFLHEFAALGGVGINNNMRGFAIQGLPDVEQSRKCCAAI